MYYYYYYYYYYYFCYYPFWSYLRSDDTLRNPRKCSQ